MDAKIFAILEVQFEGRFWMGHRYVTIAEAEAELLRGNWYRFRRPRQSMRTYRQKPQVAPSTSEETPSCITVGDMLANAGLASLERVAEARRKVREFGRMRVMVSNTYAGAAIPTR